MNGSGLGMNVKRSLESTNWPPVDPSQVQGLSSAKKKKRSRWGAGEVDKTFIPGMPTVIPHGMEKEQEEQYLLQLQIEEISRKLRTGDFGIPLNPEDRSPSPEPIYNHEGKRLNTREYRMRKRLEEERHALIQKQLNCNPEYKPPADYKPPVVRVSDKVMIPQEEHPDINFVGLLIGPRGNTLKNLEKDTGAKIIIRGKGSVRDGKIRKDGQPLPGEDEPLHAYITANNPEFVKKAVEKIKEIIRQGIEVPEGQNDLRRQQLRELALLNGTLRENDALSKLKQLQQAQTIVTNTIICSVCGGTGHIAQDCKSKRPGDTFRAMQNSEAVPQVDKARMDSEYMSLMAELGEGPPPPMSKPPQMAPAPQVPPPVSAPQQSRFGPPPIGAPPPWRNSQPPAAPPHGGFGAPPPPVSMSQPPPQMVRPPPPTSVSAPSSMPPPPWQQMTAPPPNTSTAGMTPPPPNILALPPPPPPNSQAPPTSAASYAPWQQQTPQSMSMPPPPPAVGQAPPPPWQHGPPPVAPVPPPPPTSVNPWQQSTPPPMQPPMGMPGPIPPPPPPSSGGFNPVAPPPPPPTASISGIPLGVPPPPPPN